LRGNSPPIFAQPVLSDAGAQAILSHGRINACIILALTRDRVVMAGRAGIANLLCQKAIEWFS